MSREDAISRISKLIQNAYPKVHEENAVRIATAFLRKVDSALANDEQLASIEMRAIAMVHGEVGVDIHSIVNDSPLLQRVIREALLH